MKTFERVLVAGALIAGGCTDSDRPSTRNTLKPLPVEHAQAYPNDACLRKIKPGDTLSGIGNEVGLSYTYLIAENGITDEARILAGAVLDICFNQINDETGEPRQDPYGG